MQGQDGTHYGNFIRIAQDGMEAERFVQSEIGKKIFQRADMQEMEAFEKFLSLSPGDTQEVIKVQQAALVARKVKVWLVDMINAGLAAEEVIHGEQPVE